MPEYQVRADLAEMVISPLIRGDIEKAKNFAHAHEELYKNGWWTVPKDGPTITLVIPGRKPRWHCTIWPPQVSP